jgi:signal transduction histidine kinase
MSSLSLVKAYGEQNDTVKQSRHIQKIKSSIGNLTDILNDFLSVSKLEEGKVEHVQEQFEIQRYINEVVSEMELFCKAGQKITYHHTGGEMVLLDKKLIKHILYNLLSNAVKFSAENKMIKITTERTESEFKISVQDQGIGISQKDQKHLFQRFFRAKNASNIQGTGLGLNIIENYIELMNGTINFTSVENEGTTFNLSFPQ